MSWKDEIERIAADHRANTDRLDDRLAAAKARLAARSAELAAEARAEPPAEPITQAADPEEKDPDEEAETFYRPKSWLI
ncbi:hypothetical protein [Antrihabitans cavernicola]|uniref:Uncharacterized protein n=1 Tax=Antrihabitans cavernicola TaxID=2495913 RepID=A0A5A7SC74_9NOCA|nr:hypothetical protein [Spelaeibacter cavernicola]KAA0022762.1 hypothetical protein FOY51_13900 [Spelaeibacter cavernicola]